MQNLDIAIMEIASNERKVVTPSRYATADDPAALFTFALNEMRNGPVALATLIEIRGGAARTVGSHVVVCGDGRFAGYPATAISHGPVIAWRRRCYNERPLLRI